MNFSDYESWFETNKALLPSDLKDTLEKGRGHLAFIFTWKEYERIMTPKLTTLMHLQYPLLQKADASFAPLIAQNIEHRIFELMEEMWKIYLHNREGRKPQEAMSTLYPVIMRSKKDWDSPGHLYDLKEESKQPQYCTWSRNARRRWINRLNRDRWRAFNWRKRYYAQFIDVMQADLLKLLPELLNIDAEWWDVYVFFLRFQCDTWKACNEEYCFLIEHGLTAEWLDKPHEELMEIVRAKRREQKLKKKKPDQNISDL